jgi:hypothetical protein
MPPDKVITEARARIIWGDSAASVCDYLVSNGISSSVADAKLAEFSLERNCELRRIGFRNLLVGIVLTGAASITLYLAFSVDRLGGGWLTSGKLKVEGLVLLAGTYGLWKIGHGVFYLIRPQSEHKSIPDIEQSDILE